MPEIGILRPHIAVLGGDTSVRVTAVNPFSSRLPGGGTATLSGWGFRRQFNGAQPTVKIGPNVCTNVLVLDPNTLTFTVPAGDATQAEDITVTIDGNVGTLQAGFTYISEQILRISPAYGPLIGGTQVTIYGVNFDPNIKYRVRFGASDFATNVNVIDQNTILATTPNHAIGFVDVVLMNENVMFAPAIFSPAIFHTAPVADFTYTTFRNGFQYTLLVRGQDIRRNPGISISESLGAAPSTCNFRIDGRSNIPVGGEKIQITDSFDSGRLLWAGTVQSVKQVYEGLITQIAWDAQCVDFTWLANRIRPKGAWFQTSASQVVKELVAQCCPGFTSNFVQTNLAKVTIVCDGSDDLITVLNNIAEAIGGGHWYFDFTQDLHFFHKASNLAFPDPPIDTSLVTGYVTLTAGAATPALTNYQPGYYAIRTQFVYSDGTLSGLSPWSNLVYFDGTKLFSLANIPIGPARGSLTTVARRLWVHRFSAITDPALRDTIWRVLPFCQLNDNTTTSFTTFYGSAGASVAGVADIASGIAVPDASNPNHPPAPATPPSAAVSSFVNGDPLWWTGSWFNYRYAYLYRDGSVSMASAVSNNIGYQYMTKGYVVSTARVGVAPGPVIGTNNDCIARLVFMSQGVPHIQGYSESWSGTGPGVGYGQGVPGYLLDDPVWSTGPGMVTGIGVIPDNTTDHIHMTEGALGAPVYPAPGSVGQSGYSAFWTLVSGLGDDLGNPLTAGTCCCFGSAHSGLFLTNADKSYQFTPDPVPAWPNTDGPYLEDVNNPDPINDANTSLLFEGAGNPFNVTTDRSQVRNRIFVIGAGSTLTQAYVDGSVKLYVADITSFALAGGRLRIEDVPTGNMEFADYTGLAQKDGVPYIVLRSTLSFQYSQNAVVYNFYQADDKKSQDFMAKTELDYLGRPTDGVHEFTITDSNLKTVWQLYMRAYAELELFAWPIVSIDGSTRDPKMRIGKTVHVDLTNPPCQGDFLIQQVNVDQVRDESDSVAPRYTFKASSVRYDLNDLLLKILSQNDAGGVSVGGIANAGTNQSGQSPVTSTNIFTSNPVKFGYTFPAFNGVSSNSQWVYSPVGEPTAVNATVFGGQPNGKTLADGRQFGLACVGAGPGNSNPMGQTSLILGMPGLGAKARWLLRTPTKAEMDLSLNPNALNTDFGIGTSILGIGAPVNRGVYVSFNGNAGGGQRRDHWYMNVIGTDANYFFDIGAITQDSDYDFLFEELDTTHFKMTVIGLGASPAAVPSGVSASSNSTGTGVSYIVPFRATAGDAFFVAGHIQTTLITTNGMLWVRRVEWSCN